MYIVYNAVGLLFLKVILEIIYYIKFQMKLLAIELCISLKAIN